jgi:hypothetical protein
MTTAVITSSSKPSAATASTLGNRDAHMKPPSPARAPQSVKARITRRPARMPANRAASGFEPIA